MPRPIRLSFPGALHHITCRGNGDDEIFKDDNDRQRYLDTLHRYKTTLNFSLFAYVLMDNHVHLLLQVNNILISKILQMINTSYTTYFNFRHNRHGHLFQGRFHSSIVDKQSYLLELTRYIHLNPVRANLVERPESWQWSSCRCYLGQENSDLVDTDEALKLLNLRNPHYQYAGFLKDGIDYKLPIIVKNSLWYIADHKFVNRISRHLSK